jgi:hypothetical protein
MRENRKRSISDFDGFMTMANKKPETLRTKSVLFSKLQAVHASRFRQAPKPLVHTGWYAEMTIFKMRRAFSLSNLRISMFV